MASGKTHFHIPCLALLVFFSGSGQALDGGKPRHGQHGAADKSICGKAATPISTIQGAGASSPLIGKEVDVEAVVVGRFQGTDGWGGLFIEEEHQDRDRNAGSSEGLFIHTALPASVGDLVHVQGSVAEFKGLTELHPVRTLVVCREDVALPLAIDLRLPLASKEMLEALESMRVALPQTLTIIDTHQLWQFGELAVSSERQVQPTQAALPGKKALAVSRAQALDRLIIDDGRAGRYLLPRVPAPDKTDSDNTDSDKPDSDKPRSTNPMSDNSDPLIAGNSIRTGQHIAGLAGVLHFAFGHYRLQPTAPFTLLTQANPRSSHPPVVGGTFRVASFNVLNYFSTLKDSGRNCGPALSRGCRGADNTLEQHRQLQKLVAAISAIDAGILGVLELENNPEQSLRDLVDGLNKVMGAGHYAFIPTGTIGRDVIKAGLLYQPALVTPQGRFALLDGRIDHRFDDALNRPALAQSFRMAQGDRTLTVVVTHLKSKNCSGADGKDQDQQDGQGCFNASRTRAVSALAEWALHDPTGQRIKQLLIVGDFNSHRMEDPVRAMEKSGLVSLLARQGDGESYTYVYDGRIGTLDYAYASPQLLPFVSGVGAWHINADESAMLDYNIEPGKPADYFAKGPFRSSDHDPVIIGLELKIDPPAK